jgi:formylglycine-generating enzyme required for sulfatase activity
MVKVRQKVSMESIRELMRDLVSVTLILFATGCSTAPLATPPEPTATSIPPGQTRLDAKHIEQVWVPAGSFMMGTSEAAAQDVLALKPPYWVRSELPSEQPQHEVRLTSGYWIDKFEVTNAAFQAFVDEGGYLKREYWSEAGWKWLSDRHPSAACSDQAAKQKPNYPCIRVTWYEAEAYARWRGGRLPTEAEWEFAARGPQSLIYPWGNTFDSGKANVVQSTGLAPVGSFAAGKSWVGAYDMAGNAMEWVQDWLDTDYYKQAVRDNPPGPAAGTIKIEKGGWWGSNQFVARSAYRHFEDLPDYKDGHIGFRIVQP